MAIKTTYKKDESKLREET